MTRPDEDPAMDKIMGALSEVQPPDCKLVAVGDFNVPELHWNAPAGGIGDAVPDMRRATGAPPSSSTPVIYWV